MTAIRILLFASILMAISTLPKLTFSKPADAKKTEKSCLYCHTKYGSKDLTKAGKYYKDNGTLDGFKEANEALQYLQGFETPGVRSVGK